MTFCLISKFLVFPPRREVTPVLARTYNYSYFTDANYTSRYIRNRLTHATVTGGGAVTTLVSEVAAEPGAARPARCRC